MVMVPAQASGNGDGLQSWKAGTDPCYDSWDGVECDGSEMKLDLSDSDYASLTGSAAALAALVVLTQLDLSSTKVTGTLKELAPLVTLADLSLHSTTITGTASDLAPLVKLTSLDLGQTNVTGCGAYCQAHHNIDDCDCPKCTLHCGSYGVCSKSSNGPKCSCNSGFSGSSCETWPPAYTLSGVCARDGPYVKHFEGLYMRSNVECNSAPAYTMSSQGEHYYCKRTIDNNWMFTSNASCSDDRGYISSDTSHLRYIQSSQSEPPKPPSTMTWSENDGGKDSKWYNCASIKVTPKKVVGVS
jgi:hypothetical protein